MQDKPQHPHKSAISVSTPSGSLDTKSTFGLLPGQEESENTNLSPETSALIQALSSIESNIPYKSDKLTQSEFEKQAIERGNLENQSFNQDIIARGKYTERIYNLIRCWLIGIGITIFLQGSCSKQGFFNLSDKVLVTLIGGTTINILGLFAIVAWYLFHKPKS
jgi:hypothetical protein